MNKLFLFLLLFSSFVFAEELKPYVSPTLEKPMWRSEFEDVPKINHYESFLLFLKDSSDNFSNIDHYKEIKIKINGEVKKISELDPDTINLFFIYQGELLSDSMIILQNLWKKEMETSSGISKKQLQMYFDALLKIRKDHAVHFEKEMVRLLFEIKSISDVEKKNYITKIKNWNVKHGLKKD